MKNDNKILSALLDHLISSSEDGEAEEIDKWGGKCEEAKPQSAELDQRPEVEDEESKKMKKFLAALKD